MCTIFGDMFKKVVDGLDKGFQAFHSDKIQGKGLDPEWLEFANEKSAMINAAYKAIRAVRG